MGATPVAYIDATGCHVPAFSEELAYFKDGMRGIYGQDLPLDNAEMDGQWLGLLASALHDVNSGIFAAYKSFRPSESEGVPLSSLVKINGLARAVPTYSAADMLITGVAGTVIENGLVADAQGNTWRLPPTITIPVTGETTATAVCSVIGAIEAPANTISAIQNVTRGWQEARNPNPAVPGAAVERDVALRRRQTLSTSIPAKGVIEASVAAILTLPGVVSVMAYENDTRLSDANGQAPNSVAYIVEGGDAQAIADMIRRKKGPGVSTYGTTVMTSYDTAGVPHRIAFFRSISVPVSVYLTINPGQGYTMDVQRLIARTVSDWVNALPKGDDIVRTRVMLPANLNNNFPGNTYELKDLQLSRDGQGPSASNVSIGYNEKAVMSPDDVQFYLPNNQA